MISPLHLRQILVPRWDRIVGAAAVALGVGACTGVQSSERPGGDAGPLAAQQTTVATARCSTDADCAAAAPPTTPASCAVGRCNALERRCEYVAADQDGDGHAASRCASSNGIAIEVGDDCNDHDPDLYPGHPKTCAATPDGGPPTGMLCGAGQVRCLDDGSESSCTGAVFCPLGCVGSVCTDCTPGQSRCAAGNGLQSCSSSGTWNDAVSCGTGASCVVSGGAATCSGSCAAGSTICGGSNGVRVCTSDGTWSDPVACVNQTCFDGVCRGNCAPLQTACSGNGVLSCSNGGTWGAPAACDHQTCVSGSGLDAGAGAADATVGTASGAACQGACAPGELHCNGSQPQTCDIDGQWKDSGQPCSGSTPACTNGRCGTCPPGGYGCNGSQPQHCNATGTAWSNVGPACAGATTPACLDGQCVECSPAALRCSGPQPQLCDSSGAWTSNGAPCVDQACVSGVCTGSCSPDASQCASGTQVETCGSDGQWGAATTCPNACVSGTGVTGGACGGDCVPGAVCAASCTGGVQTAASTCDSTGSCGASKTVCGPYACGPTACNTSCSAPGDCAPGNVCLQSVCVPRIEVGAGIGFSCAITNLGAQCWGDDIYGQLGDQSQHQTSQVPVAVTLAAADVTALVVGSYHACSLSPSAGVACWGANSDGQLGTNMTSINGGGYVTGVPSGATSVAAGYYHTCALASGGVMCWGRNASGQLGNGSAVSAAAPVAVAGLSSGVVAISAGSAHTCAVTSAGAVMCWGSNSSGQLGTGSTTDSLVPVAVAGLSSGVVAISAGSAHTCAVTDAGGLLCWGANDHAQLGDNSATRRTTPVAVTGFSSGVAAVSAGYEHTCALTAAGAVKCWGYNGYGQLGNNSITAQLVPTAVYGLSSGVAAVAAGQYHTCALTIAGAAQCWGYNSKGQLGNNSTTQSLVPVSIAVPVPVTDAGAADASTPDAGATEAGASDAASDDGSAD